MEQDSYQEGDRPQKLLGLFAPESSLRSAPANFLSVTASGPEGAEEDVPLKAETLRSGAGSAADNIFVTLTAKELNPALFVVARAETERSERTLLRSGADKVISPYAMGGHRKAQAALRPAVVDIIDLATHQPGIAIGADRGRR